MAPKKKSHQKLKKKKVAQKPKIAKPSLFKRLFKFGFLLALWGLIIGFFVGVYFYLTLPNVGDIQLISQNQGVEIYDREARRIARFGQQRGETAVIEALPPHVGQAVIAIEDKRFYQHPGIDVLGIARAMLVNIKAGGFVQGGSTLTQQLAKNLFLTADKTLVRKIQEAMMALWLEHKLTKDEILTAYLNRVYFGQGIYGVTAAADKFFNRPAGDLTVEQAAQLAASLKAPSRLNPISNPEGSTERAKIVLDYMVAEDFITLSDRNIAVAALENQKQQRLTDQNIDRPWYFTDWVLDDLNSYTSQVPDGFVVETTQDPDIFKIAMDHITRFFQSDAALTKDIGQIALVIMEYDGTLRTMIGGKSYAKSQFNRATQALRQPGSAFKPFVYLTALEHGYKPSSMIYDGAFETGSYRPANFNKEYLGDVPLSEALSRSLNTPAVRLTQDIGIGNVKTTAQNLGITTPIKSELASALGASETHLIDLVSAYAVIANGGRAVYPYGITKIQDGEKAVLFEKDDNRFGPRIFSKNIVQDLKYMLRGVVQHGTGRRSYVTGVADQGGKTGTSQNYRDALYVGYAGGYVMGIWMGNDDNTPMKNVTGGGDPARLWGAIMQDVIETRPLDVRRLTRESKGGLFNRMLRGWTSGGHKSQKPRGGYNN